MLEKDELKMLKTILKEMAELNLRKEDHHRVELIQEPLRLIFKNLQIHLGNDHEYRFSIMDLEIKKFLAGENFNHSDPENKDLFDRIKKFIELFKKIFNEIYNSDREELLRDKDEILSIYTRYLNDVMLNEEE